MAYTSPAALAELRHQIAAMINANLTAGAEPATATDTAKATDYLNKRKANTIVNGDPLGGVGAQLPTDHVFYNWINAGKPAITNAELPDVVIQLVNQFMNRVPAGVAR